MASKCDWEVGFTDGTMVTVKAAGKRLAKAAACVLARKSPDEVASWSKLGRTKNGAKPRNPNRPQPYSEGYYGRHQSIW